jgi:hypothetical protein
MGLLQGTIKLKSQGCSLHQAVENAVHAGFQEYWLLGYMVEKKLQHPFWGQAAIWDNLS